MITTIFPRPLAAESAAAIRRAVLERLKSRPGEPCSLAELARQLQLSLAQVERAVTELEGPLAADSGETDAYLHQAKCSPQAVYIP